MLLIVAQVVAFMIKISILRFKALCVALSLFYFWQIQALASQGLSIVPSISVNSTLI